VTGRRTSNGPPPVLCAYFCIGTSDHHGYPVGEGREVVLSSLEDGLAFL
jgi:hypothetical protein